MALPAWVYIVAWITISCTMIMFNKAVLDQMKFPFPMFLTTWHMLLATVLTQIMAKTTSMLPAVREEKVDQSVFMKNIVPVAAFFSVSLVCANKAYIFLSVSYIQMLKAFTPVAVLIFSFVAGLEKPSYMEVYIVTVICVGVAITSVGEAMFSWTGFIFQSIAILAESSRLVLTNILMKQLKLDPLSSLYYIAPACCLFIGTACVIFESGDLPWDRIMTTDFAIIMLVNGGVAFSLNVAVVLLIGNTSALVLTLSGIIKDILLVFFSVSILGAPVTPTQYAGYAVALMGLNLHKEFKKNPERISGLVQYMLSCGMATGK